MAGNVYHSEGGNGIMSQENMTNTLDKVLPLEHYILHSVAGTICVGRNCYVFNHVIGMKNCLGEISPPKK
jgi:hypothetical protein